MITPLHSIVNTIMLYLFVASLAAVILTFLGLGIVKILQIKAPIYSYMIWFYILISIVILPLIWLSGIRLNWAVMPAPTQHDKIITTQNGISSNEQLVQSVQSEDSAVSVPVRQSAVVFPQAASDLVSVKTSVGLVWALGFLFMTGRLLVGWFRFRKIILSSGMMPQSNLSRPMADRNIKVLLTSQTDSPGCFGILKPIILLPRAIYDTSSPRDIQMVLDHELAHIERGDCRMVWFQRLIEAVFFFHPLVWYVSSQLTRQRECICDNFVLARGASATYYVELLTRFVEHGFEKRRFQTVALFEGGLLSRVRFLLDPQHNPRIKASRSATLLSICAVLIGILCCVVRLEAKPQPNTSPESAKTETEHAVNDVNNIEPIDSNDRQLGEEVSKRLTTYTDEEMLTIQTGQTGVMKVKENIAGVAGIRISPHVAKEGTSFDLEMLDGKGSTIGNAFSTGIIHDGDSHRSGISVSAGGEEILCKTQVTVVRRETDGIIVQAKALFTKQPTPEEINAMLTIKGKEGRLQQHFSKIALEIALYKQKYGSYPENLEKLNTPLPADVYSISNETYHYEHDQARIILSSCGEDGIYGNEDDEIFIAGRNKARSGTRGQLYPLEEENPSDAEEILIGQRPKGNCSIRGKVISAQTGEPIGHARLSLQYRTTHAAILVSVASDGTFEFTDLPVGPFSLRMINTAGFQDAAYNPESKSETYPQFTLEENEQRAAIIIEARRACRISGKISDEKGNPPTKVNKLNVLAWMEKEDGEGYDSKQGLVSQDGAYFIDGLDGRPVYVMAIDWRAAQQGNAYPPIYYPGVFSKNDAKQIIFGENYNFENVDIRLQNEGGLVLEGSVIDQAGNPVPEAFVVAHTQDMLFDFVTAYTDQQGKYQIQGLGDGQFLVHVDAVHRGYVRMRMPIEINHVNQKTQLDFTLNRGVTISGIFVNRDGSDWEIGQSSGYATVTNSSAEKSAKNNHSFSLTDFHNKYGLKDMRDYSFGSFSDGQGDYEGGNMIFPTKNTFILQGLIPGKTVIGFAPQKEGETVKEILLNGRNILDDGLETKPGDEISNIAIVIGKI